MADDGTCPVCGRSDATAAALRVVTDDLEELLAIVQRFHDAAVPIEHGALIRIMETRKLLRAPRPTKKS